MIHDTGTEPGAALPDPVLGTHLGTDIGGLLGVVAAAAALLVVQPQGHTGNVVSGIPGQQGGNRAVHAAGHCDIGIHSDSSVTKTGATDGGP